MADFQTEVALWANTTFPTSTSATAILHLFEELEELWTELETPEQREELADAGLIVLHLASFLQVEIPITSKEFQAEMARKLEICRRREWNEPGADGVVHHKKD